MKILVVDDSRDTAESFAALFRGHGHEVEVIGHSGKCLETMPQDFRPDVLLIDTSMPKAFIDKVLARTHAPAVALTSGGAAPGALAAAPLLRKPAQPSAVLAELEHAAGEA